jgi:phage gp45-like
MMIKGTISNVTDAAYRTAVFAGRYAKYGARAFVQQFGFRSRPNDNAQAILVRFGDNMVIIGTDDSRYTITLQPGEAVMHNSDGDKVHMKSGREIDVVAGDSENPGTINITANGTLGKVCITANGEVDVSAPVVKMGGVALDTALGIVTGACSCSLTGAPHAVTSQTVKATL